MQKYLLALCLLLSVLAVSSQAQDKAKEEISGDLIIFHAGSLSLPFKQVADSFKKKYPKVNIMSESAGSVDCARKITELNKPCDIMASADFCVIDQLLIPKYTDWNIKFANNEIALVHTETSKYANEMTKENWHKILLKDDVVLGRADPNADPCGYRSVFTMQLAEKHYGETGLSELLLNKKQTHIRPKEVDLLALLESKSIDYIFLYRSVAEQHNLPYFRLPNEVNLGDDSLADYYKTSSVKVKGKQPGEEITIEALPIIYGITILKEAPHKKTSLAFVSFLLGQEGKAIIEKNGQGAVAPLPTDTFNSIPQELKEFALPVKSASSEPAEK